MYAPDATTHMVVPAPTTPPPKADERRWCPLVIDACLSLPLRANDLRQAKPNPANTLAGVVAGQTLTTLLTLVTNPDDQVLTLMTTNNWARGCSIIVHSRRRTSEGLENPSHALANVF